MLLLIVDLIELLVKKQLDIAKLVRVGGVLQAAVLLEIDLQAL